MTIFTGEYFDRYRLESLSDDMVDAAEKKLKVKLPAAYISLMREQNGGELSLKKFENTILEEGYLELDYLYGIGQKGGEGILIDSYTRKEWGLSGKLVYLHGDSHEWIALDYRRYSGDNPPVVYYETDTKQSIRIADDFADFLSRLTILEEQVPKEFQPEEEFVREEVEKALLGGRNKYVMTAGLHYFGLFDDDLNWFLSQLLGSIKRMLQNRPFEDTYTIDCYLDIVIDIIRKKKVNLKNYAQTKELFEILTNFPDTLDDRSLVRNKSRKIQHYFEVILDGSM